MLFVHGSASGRAFRFGLVALTLLPQNRQLRPRQKPGVRIAFAGLPPLQGGAVLSPEFSIDPVKPERLRVQRKPDEFIVIRLKVKRIFNSFRGLEPGDLQALNARRRCPENA